MRRAASFVLSRLPRSPRAQAVFAFDIAAAAGAWWIAFLLRFNFSVPPEYTSVAVRALAWVLPAYAAAFIVVGLYRGLWRFASLNDARRIAQAAALGGAAVAAAAYLLQLDLPIPRSVIVLSPALVLLVMGGARAAYRSWIDFKRQGTDRANARPLIVVGASEAAASLLRSLQGSAEWRVVGILDDNRSLHGREVLGQRIVGALDELAAIKARYGVRDAVIALPDASGAQRRRAAEACLSAGVRASILPPLESVLDGRVSLKDLRGIDLNDLLGRDPVRIDSGQVAGLIRGRAILVTGAGGSIGRELCRQIARFAPGKLVFIEHGEYALYQLVEEFRNERPDISIEARLADVKDTKRIDDIFSTARPDVVFHAAAYKHVSIVESGNESAALNNNAWGTHVVAQASARHGVRNFVLISTDKAVRPTSVMGATKRLAEMICQAHQQQAPATRFTMVRFGNVLGSAGSVVPKFTQQIERGGPVTVTHPEVTRYFMSIPEATQLVMQASAIAGPGQILVLDMGKPVRIVDLARQMIALAGRTEDVEVVYTGLVPGEKLHEELMAQDEVLGETPHPSLRVARVAEVGCDWLEHVSTRLRKHLTDGGDARSLLVGLVPEFKVPACGPGERGK